MVAVGPGCRPTRRKDHHRSHRLAGELAGPLPGLAPEDVNLKTAFYSGLTLGIVGAIGMFPPFFELFE